MPFLPESPSDLIHEPATEGVYYRFLVTCCYQAVFNGNRGNCYEMGLSPEVALAVIPIKIWT